MEWRRHRRQRDAEKHDLSSHSTGAGAHASSGAWRDDTSVARGAWTNVSRRTPNIYQKSHSALSKLKKLHVYYKVPCFTSPQDLAAKGRGMQCYGNSMFLE